MKKCYLGKGFNVRQCRQTTTKTILSFVVVLVAMYVFYGLFSLAGVAAGENTAYLPFWHEPWRWLIKLLG